MMRKWTVALGVALFLSGCGSNGASNQTSSSSTAGDTKAGTEAGDAKESAAAEKPGAGGKKKAFKNYPQEELAKRDDAVKLSGRVDVPGYEKGIIQIDVFPAGQSGEGNGPLTTARFQKPGAFELLLPPDVEAVELSAILDFKGDGPQFDDATATYEKNPITVGDGVTGIVIEIDKNNTKPVPPHDPNVDVSDDKPPWELGKSAADASSGNASSADAPKAEPAAPGAKGGPKEGVNPAGGGETGSGG